MLTFPRADPRAQRKRLPARWVLESARALGATTATAEELRDEVDEPWLEIVQSFDQLVTSGEPGSATEYRLRCLHDWHAVHRDLASTRSLRVRSGAGSSRPQIARRPRRPRSTASSGTRPDLAPGQDRPTSPTALQEWAACPFRYFLGRVLRLRAIPRPEDTETISPLDRGSLIHAILEDFVRESPTPAAPDEPWTAEDELRMLEILERHCCGCRGTGHHGRDVNWVLAKRRIFQDAMRFLDTDVVTRTAVRRPARARRPRACVRRRW